MAGKSLFKHGRHLSRDAIGVASIKASAASKLRAEIAGMLAKRITDADFARLLDSALLTKAHSGIVRNGEEGGEIRHAASYFDPHLGGADIPALIRETVAQPVGYEAVRRKDIAAQLRAMVKIRNDNDLLTALQNCDHWTFEAIQREQIRLTAKVISDEGQFTDANGDRNRIPAEIQLGCREDDPPYLPLGMTGLRESIANALVETDAKKDHAGPPEKPYQHALANECIIFWKKFGEARQRKPWETTDTGRQSQIVSFADVVFKAAGMTLSSRRLIALLKDARRLRAQQLWEARYLTSRLRIKTKTAN